MLLSTLSQWVLGPVAVANPQTYHGKSLDLHAQSCYTHVMLGQRANDISALLLCHSYHESVGCVMTSNPLQYCRSQVR
ncbi:hypothetical protein BC629DRAFT_1228818 [Irpex lacteus]|nr:hypothetical protein BC629DRAFT_1228818 [Irpex lacteus]